jgi:hypothetical protein
MQAGDRGFTKILATLPVGNRHRGESVVKFTSEPARFSFYVLVTRA